MAASVRIEDEAFADPRIELLGALAGYNRFEALGRLSYLWRMCTQRSAYVVSDAMVVATLGERGVDALLGSELGEREPGGGIRVRGTRGRIEWLEAKRTAAKAGGEAKRSRMAAITQPNGLPNEAETQPTPCPPTLTPTLTLSPVHDPKTPVVPTGDVSRRGSKRTKPGEPTAAELGSVRVVLDKLTAKNGVRYSGGAEHTRLIVNQLRAGVTEMDLRKVIGYCADELWADKPEFSAKYLRPETLFGPTTIQRYLDPARAWFAKLDTPQPSETPGAHRRLGSGDSERAPSNPFTDSAFEEPPWMSGDNTDGDT